MVLLVLGAMSILQIFSANEITLKIQRFRFVMTKRWTKACALTGLSLALATILFVAIWASCSFRYTAWIDHRANHEGTAWHWNYLLENCTGPVLNTVKVARDHHLLPEQYLYGLAYVRKHEIDRPAFLDNQWSIVGFRSFFPLAFLYKTPLPFLFLLGLAIYAAIANRHSWKIENILNPLWGFALLYGAFAVSAQLNIGHRHLLPVYPALFIASGSVAYLLRKSLRTIITGAVAIVLAWQIGESVASRPNYLAYFNQIAGGPSRGYQHLVDSSLDWGQDLPALKRWIDTHAASLKQKSIYLAYFGTADPRWYKIKATPISPDKTGGAGALTLAAGVYCVSATTLQSVYAHELGRWCAPYEQWYQSLLVNVRKNQNDPVALISNDYSTPAKALNDFERLRFERLCAYLRHQKPVAQLGGSILIFDLSDADIDRALYGPPVELTPTIWVRGF